MNTLRYSLLETQPLNATSDQSIQFRLLKDNYEQRLEYLTDKIKAVFDEIRTSEILSQMRQNPHTDKFVSKHMQEIVNKYLSKNQEECIERLMRENAQHQTEIIGLEKQIAVNKEDYFRVADELRSVQIQAKNLEIDNEELQEKLKDLSTNYEGNLKSSQSNARSAIRLSISEMDKAREKQAELEEDLNQQKRLNNKLQQEIQSLQEYRHKASGKIIENEGTHFQIEMHNQNLGKQSQEYKKKISELEIQLEDLQGKLNKTLQDNEELKQAYQKQSEKYQNAIEQDQFETSNMMSSISSKYHNKSRLLKNKIIDQRQQLYQKEKELKRLQKYVEGSKSQNQQQFKTWQGDLKSIQGKWKDKCAKTQEHYKQQIEIMEKEHKKQLKNINKAHQKNFKQVQGTLEQKLKDIEYDYISRKEHSTILENEISLIQEKHQNYIKNQQSQGQQKLDQLQRQLNQKIAKLKMKIANLSQNGEQQDKQIQYKQRIQQLQAQKTTLETQNNALLKQLEETSFSLSKLKNVCELKQNDCNQMSFADHVNSIESYLQSNKDLSKKQLQSIDRLQLIAGNKTSDNKQRVHYLQAKIDEKEKQINDMQEELKQKNAEISILKGRINSGGGLQLFDVISQNVKRQLNQMQGSNKKSKQVFAKDVMELVNKAMQNARVKIIGSQDTDGKRPRSLSQLPWDDNAIQDSQTDNLKFTILQLKDEIRQKNDEIKQFLTQVEDIRGQNKVKLLQSIDQVNNQNQSVQEVFDSLKQQYDNQFRKLQAQVSELQLKHREELNQVYNKNNEAKVYRDKYTQAKLQIIQINKMFTNLQMKTDGFLTDLTMQVNTIMKFQPNQRIQLGNLTQELRLKESQLLKIQRENEKENNAPKTHRKQHSRRSSDSKSKHSTSPDIRARNRNVSPLSARHRRCLEQFK